MTQNFNVLPGDMTSAEVAAAYNSLTLDRTAFYSQPGSTDYLSGVLPRATEYFDDNPIIFSLLNRGCPTELTTMRTEITDATTSAFMAGVAFAVETMIRLGEVKDLSPEDIIPIDG